MRYIYLILRYQFSKFNFSGFGFGLDFIYWLNFTATPTPALRSSAVQTPTPFEDERPKSRNVSVQTTLPKSQCCKKHKQHRVKHESSKNGEKVPQMLTVERIWTPYLGKNNINILSTPHNFRVWA